MKWNDIHIQVFHVELTFISTNPLHYRNYYTYAFILFYENEASIIRVKNPIPINYIFLIGDNEVIFLKCFDVVTM